MKKMILPGSRMRELSLSALKPAWKAAFLGVPLALAACLAGCTTDENSADMQVTPVAWSALTGEEREDWGALLPVMRAQCAHLARLPREASLGGASTLPHGRVNADWEGACGALPLSSRSASSVSGGGDDSTVNAASNERARAYFQRWFQPYALQSKAFLTGYYEPQVAASLTRTGAYQVPLYGRPADLQRARTTDGHTVFGRWSGKTFLPYDSRATIDGGSLAGKNLELAWLKDPVDLFFLQVQGSGRLVLPDGQTLRVNYDGRNGQPYVPIGRVLEKRGAISKNDMSADAIRAWLAAHPQDVRGILEENPSYVFFKTAPGNAADPGPPGAFGVPLTPGRSMAVDRRYVPFGAPVWVETSVPDPHTGGEGAWRHLVFAQDTGTDIKGAGRGDLFMGGGRYAPWVAGRLRSKGRMIVLTPRLPAAPELVSAASGDSEFR